MSPFSIILLLLTAINFHLTFVNLENARKVLAGICAVVACLSAMGFGFSMTAFR